MPRQGFIREPLDVKVVVLYVMARVAAPIPFDTLTELSLRDGAIDYFLFAQVVDELLNSGHLVRDENGLYAITDKGRTNGGIMESSIPSSVRGHCDSALAKVNATLRRNAQVLAQVAEESPNRRHVELGLSDDEGQLFSLRLTVPSLQQGEEIVQRFRDHPEHTFNAILSCLLQEPEEE